MIVGGLKNRFINKLIFVCLIKSDTNNYKTRLRKQKKVGGKLQPAERERPRQRLKIHMPVHNQLSNVTNF